ncbi:MAG: pyruvate kinase [Chloroflexota bacterium]|nr:pyruvate kinase [Chloroflexota bacterium]
MNRTKIICTIGPASRDPTTLRGLILAGMDVARLNFSHGDQEYHGETMARIRDAAAELGRPMAILCDLQGPKLRVGTIQEGGVVLKEGEEVTLTTRDVVGHQGEIPVQYEDLPRNIEIHDRILLDDGLLELEALHSKETEVVCRVVVGGLLKSNKGVNLPRSSLSRPAITDKDRDDLRFMLEQGVDWVALSFVRSERDVERLKALIEDYNPQPIKAGVIAKIEKPEAVTRIDEIITAADGIMIARGDLAIETSPEEVPMVQKMIIAKCNASGKPVIIATQMLNSMIHNPRPTRAEASDVANAILDGTDAIMLSGETAVGDYPTASVHTMVRIAQQVERSQYNSFSPSRSAGSEDRRARGQRAIANAVSHAACQTAYELDAAAIITPTSSGYTARMVSRHRPKMPIAAIAHNARVQRQLMLQWGVHPLLAKRAEDTDQTIARAVRTARSSGIVKAGDTVVITAGSASSGPGTTDIMKVQVVAS